MRNIVTHEYANVDVKIVWDVAIVETPQIIAVLPSSSSPTPNDRS